MCYFFHVSFPQDVPSRHFLNRNSDKPKHWALAVVIAKRVAELQRWEGDRMVESVAGPKGELLQFDTTTYRLTVHTKKTVWEWNPKDGALAERKRAKGEAVKEVFRAVPGEPQFRGQGDWGVAIIDGDVRACPPHQLYAQTKAKWDALPAPQKASLLGTPALVAFGGHMKGAMKLLKYALAACAVATPVLWYFLT